MQDRLIDQLAARHGIAAFYHGTDGRPVETPENTKRHLLEALGIALADDGRADPGLNGSAAAASEPAPGVQRACHLPHWLEHGRAWGITLQLYELRSARDWGIGDFSDLAQLAAIGARAGADFIGLTPLHAPFMADPHRASPFSPSNRSFLNPLYIAVDEVTGFDASLVDPAKLDSVKTLALVDYPAVAALKLDALQRIHGLWAGAASAEEADDFAAFKAERGEPLRRHALFEALSHEMVAQGHGSGWTSWPADFHDVDGDPVARFAAGNEEAIGFHSWLQWLADRQLAKAHRAARDAGMRIGLYVDLAVGEAPDGSAVWSSRADYMERTTIGAPPDYFTTDGQEWGIAALTPDALAGEHRRFIELLKAVTRHAGALRIDHVMALRQLFLVPENTSAAHGAHLRYPFDALVGQLAELSHECELVVIGEDLGHVPEGFRDVMQAARILSYRILYFEKDDQGRFLAGWDYPRISIACLSTHDLPTMRGWWKGADIELRHEYGLIDDEAARTQTAERALERTSLLATTTTHLSQAEQFYPGSGADEIDRISVAAHGFIADTPAVLAATRLADLVGEDAPTNLPGTSDTYPNWRRRCPVSLEEVPAQPLFRGITSMMASRRPRS